MNNQKYAQGSRWCFMSTMPCTTVLKFLIQTLHPITLRSHLAFHQMHHFSHMSQVNHHKKSLSDFFSFPADKLSVYRRTSSLHICLSSVSNINRFHDIVTAPLLKDSDILIVLHINGAVHLANSEFLQSFPVTCV